MNTRDRQKEIKRPTVLPKLLGLIVIILLVVQVFVSNRLAKTGYQITQIETKVEILAQENELLTSEIASASSLLAISEKAKLMGFTKTIQPVYLSHEQPVARVLQ